MRGDDHAENLFGAESRGVDAMHRERGVGLHHSVRDGFDQRVPSRCRLVPRGEAASAFVFGADEVVGDGLGQPGRQSDAEPGAQSVVAGQAPGEVAFHDDRDAVFEVTLDLVGCGEQCGEVQAHPRIDVGPLVHLVSEGLVQGRHGGDEDGFAGGGEHRCDGRLAGAS